MSWLVRHRVTVLVAIAAVVAIAGSAWLGRGSRAYAAALDPGNPDGSGAQAVARVLDDQGLQVDVVRSQDALDAATLDASTTVVVTSTGNLGRSTTRHLLRHQGDAHLVVVAPGPQLLRQLGVGTFSISTTPDASVPADCLAYDDLAVKVEAAQAYGGGGCFHVPDGAMIADPQPGLTLLGAADILTNDQVLEADNAAVALRLLGQRPRLVWYVPSLTDLRGADSVSARSLLPDWLTPALWVVALAGVGLVVWRSRRLGPLAHEPLPVSVKAVETTRNLGRLYRRSGDRTHAAETLRGAARARLAQRLHLPRRVRPDLLVADVAASSGRPVEEIDLLIGEQALPPHDDRALADLARRLDELDREVSHR